MRYYLHKYWAEILTFGAIFAVLLICNLPAMTWINTDSDGAHYILSAKYMGVAHNTSAPLYLLLGRLFLFLPFGSDAWRMGLISVIATTICAVLIYKSVMYLLNKKYYDREDIVAYRPKLVVGSRYAIIASLIYGGSALVITQSTIIETYALCTCLSIAAYYCCQQGKWKTSAIILGLILAVHPLFFAMVWFVLLIAYKELRTIKIQAITWSFLIFYAYIPITKMVGDVPLMWGNSSFIGFFKNNFGTMWMLAGGLSLYDIPKRIIDTILILGVSMGFGLIAAIWYFIKERTLRSKLLWLFVIPIVYFMVNLSAETYVYVMPAIAFGAIAVGLALSKIKRKVFVYATGVVAVALMAFNANYLDIGRTLDPNLSAQKYYDEELPKIADGEIYLGGGWTWAIVYLYNKEEGRNIIPICTDILPSQEYLNMLEANGIKLTRTDSESFIDRQWLVAKSIAEQNDNVWIAKEINPKQLSYEIVPSITNMELITRWLGYNVQPHIVFEPSNPYEYITGALEVGEWKFILKSDNNARRALVLAVYGIGAVWVLERLFKRKKDDSPKTQEEDTSSTQ